MSWLSASFVGLSLLSACSSQINCDTGSGAIRLTKNSARKDGLEFDIGEWTPRDINFFSSAIICREDPDGFCEPFDGVQLQLDPLSPLGDLPNCDGVDQSFDGVYHGRDAPVTFTLSEESGIASLVYLAASDGPALVSMWSITFDTSRD